MSLPFCSLDNPGFFYGQDDSGMEGKPKISSGEADRDLIFFKFGLVSLWFNIIDWFVITYVMIF